MLEQISAVIEVESILGNCFGISQDLLKLRKASCFDFSATKISLHTYLRMHIYTHACAHIVWLSVCSNFILMMTC